MDRRALLLSAGTVLTAGCTGNPANETDTGDDSTGGVDDQTSTPTATETPPGSVGQSRVIGYWVESPPEGADPFPTDEDPISGNDALHDVFETAATQSEWDGSDTHDEDGDFDRGETVVGDVSDETMDEIVDDLRRVGRYDNGGRAGYYFDHDGTYIWITVETLDG